MIRPGTVLWLLLVITVGYAMFQVKYEVMQQEDALARINREIADTRDQIRVLDAEWSYLSQPNRLKRLASRYLDLSPINAAQIVELSAIPERPTAQPAVAANAAPAAAPLLQTMLSPAAAPRIAPIRKSTSP
jgi:cell division protein FtsL